MPQYTATAITLAFQFNCILTVEIWDKGGERFRCYFQQELLPITTVLTSRVPFENGIPQKEWPISGLNLRNVIDVAFLIKATRGSRKGAKCRNLLGESPQLTNRLDQRLIAAAHTTLPALCHCEGLYVKFLR